MSDGAKSDSANIQGIFRMIGVVAVQDPAYPVYVDSAPFLAELVRRPIPVTRDWCTCHVRRKTVFFLISLTKRLI